MQQRPRLLFMNRSFWPDHEATGQLLTQLCSDLSQEFDVHVLCGHPMSGDRQPLDREKPPELNNVTVHRVRHTRFNKKSTWGRLANLISFTAAAYFHTRRLPRPDLIICETDPFFLPLVADRCRRQHRCQFIAYLQDIYPDIAVTVGKLSEGRLSRVLRNRLFNVYRHADRVIVLGEDMRQTCFRHGLPAESTAVIPNWTEVERIHPRDSNSFRQQLVSESQFLIMYSGNLGLVHELDAIVHAAALLNDKPDIQVYLIGQGVQKPRLQQLAAQLQLQNLHFLEHQPYDQLPVTLTAPDLHLVSLKPGAEYSVFPSKLYGIMASGKPVLSIAAGTSELARFVEHSGIGKNCDATLSPEKLSTQLANQILSLCDDRSSLTQMGQQARRLAETQFDRSVCSRQFAELVREVLAEAANEKPEATLPAASQL